MQAGIRRFTALAGTAVVVAAGGLGVAQAADQSGRSSGDTAGRAADHRRGPGAAESSALA